jgi:Flp pilus assembly protein TadD
MTPETNALLEEARRLDRSEQYGRAILAYKLALRADPRCLAAKIDLAGLLMTLGRQEEAHALCLEVLAERPGDLAAQQNLIGALMGLGRYEEADCACGRLLAADPGCAPAHLGLGMSLACQERHLEAEDEFRLAWALDPKDARPRSALFRSLIKLKAWDRVRTTWLAMAALDMDGPKAEFEKAMIHLTFGQYAEGWELYESRLLPPNEAGRARDYPQPLWDGSPFPGRTLLLYWEQGLGDTLMFIRYAAMARALGGRVVVEVQNSLLPVLRTFAGVDQWLAEGEPPPPFDLHLPLLSLPRVFGTRPESIPASASYLSAPRRDAGTFRLPDTGNLKVGLVWAGSQNHKHDFLRTLPPGALEPLSTQQGVDWYSLQVGYKGDVPWTALAALEPVLKDFGDTARILDQLDLLITVDTSIAHLAGAMGRPVWVMLFLLPDWRWGLEGEVTPWYPSMRLFRQQHCDDWTDVVARIGAALNQLLMDGRGTC